MSKKIITVNGEIDSNKIIGAYSHEHIIFDFSNVKKSDYKSNDEVTVIENLNKISKQINLIIDQTNITMGRKVLSLKNISNKTGVNIVTSTGFYLEEYCTEFLDMTVNELSGLIIDEIENGIGNTAIKPSLIGEVGMRDFSAFEMKNLNASIIAHNKTNIPISIHSTNGKSLIKIVDYVLPKIKNPNKVLLCHVDLNNNMDEIIYILRKGVYIGIDTIGKTNYASDDDRTKMIINIINLGFLNQILISSDITKYESYIKQSQDGYSHLVNNFIPMLAEKIGNENIKKLLVSNPVTFISM